MPNGRALFSRFAEKYVPELRTGGGDIQAIEPVTEEPGA
jgi:hypothetical protein